MRIYYLAIFVFMALIVLSPHIKAQEEGKPVAKEQARIMQRI